METFKNHLGWVIPRFTVGDIIRRWVGESHDVSKYWRGGDSNHIFSFHLWRFCCL